MEFKALTIEQVAQKYGYSISTIKAQFNRTAASIKKKYGVNLIKWENSEGQTLYQILIDKECNCMYDQSDKIINLDTEALSLEDYEFLCLLGMISYDDNLLFSGTRKEFLNRIGLAPTKKNIERLDIVLQSLDTKNYLGFQVDNTDPRYIIVYVKRIIKKQLEFNSVLYKECKRIADKNHKTFKKISQMVRVWLALQIYEESGIIFKYADISQLTGLSEKQIRDIKKLLTDQGVFKIKNIGTQVTYHGEKYYQRQGQKVVWINGFYY